MERLGVETTFTDFTNTDCIKKAIKGNTKVCLYACLLNINENVYIFYCTHKIASKPYAQF